MFILIMNRIIFFCVVLSISAASDTELWLKFKNDHTKTYKSLTEEKIRFNIFRSNLRLIEEHNAKYETGESSYYLGINQFSDLTVEEFQKLYLNSRPPKTETEDDDVFFQSKPSDVIPKAIDWRDKNVVLPVKNQGDCGSCWAFSATAALECQNVIKHNIKEELSKQELIDCSFHYGNLGCLGGWMDYAFAYVKHHGIASEKNYPYKADDVDCLKQVSRANITETAYKRIHATSENDLTEAIATVGPISVAINATLIMNYAGGIFDNRNCSKELEHAVLAVGYGTQNNQDYYIIQNSWGTTWGEHGYIKMTRNKDNQCGIASRASYPIIS